MKENHEVSHPEEQAVSIEKRMHQGWGMEGRGWGPQTPA